MDAPAAVYSYPRLLPAPQLQSEPLPNNNALPPAVIQRLTHALRNHPTGTRHVTPEFASLCYWNMNPGLADQLAGLDGSALERLGNEICLGVKAWLGRRRATTITAAQTATGTSATQGRTATTGTSPTQSRPSATQTGRSTRQSTSARARDRGRCVVSGVDSRQSEVAHIFPYARRHTAPGADQSENTHFLTTFRYFCGRETAANIEAYLGLGPDINAPAMRIQLINGSHPINRLENLITLARNLHGVFDQGGLVLEPLGDPLAIFNACTPTQQQQQQQSPVQLTSYRVRVTALATHRPSVPERGWDLTTLAYTALPVPASEDTSVEWQMLTSRAVGPGEERPPLVPLVDGTIILLTTDDPVKRPLPHPDLLRLHAGLSRVVRGAGAALEEDDDEDDYEDEGDSGGLWVEAEVEVEQDSGRAEQGDWNSDSDVHSLPRPGILERARRAAARSDTSPLSPSSSQPEPPLAPTPSAEEEEHLRTALRNERVNAYLDTLVAIPAALPLPSHLMMPTPPPSSPLRRPRSSPPRGKRSHSTSASASSGSHSGTSPAPAAATQGETQRQRKGKGKGKARRRDRTMEMGG